MAHFEELGEVNLFPCFASAWLLTWQQCPVLTVMIPALSRLLTGPMSSVYNLALRSGIEEKAGKWANTMLVAVSGIVKLSAASAPVPSGKLYRVLNSR